jgi:leucyl-tRNA synthetase
LGTIYKIIRISYIMKRMKKSSYPHIDIENRWQKVWKKAELDVARIDSPHKPFYNLMMFPYPSAEGLHVGNMYAFTGSDIYGRFKRMQGYDVFEPIGLDGFGIHSENYALKIGRHPMDHASITQKNYYSQLHKIGCMFDWDRTVETYDPLYYRWTQWLFVQMFKKGLAYRSRAEVNFCPSCKTVLADEQVIDGKCERCGNIVVKRLLEQWFFKITAYAEKLLQNSFSLDWSEKVKVAQKNWIGKKEGINISYEVVDAKGKHIGEIFCFTTRPDTNFGTTFIVIAPEHPFVSQILTVIEKEKRARITKYVEAAKMKSDDDRIAEGRKKTGAPTGLFCINKLTNTKMPLFVSDFVLTDFGTGAVVGVPSADMRDFEFAREFKIPVIRVVVGPDGDTSAITKKEQVQEESGTMINSGFLNGMDIHKATVKIMDYLEEKGWGKRVTTYHLRDWLISRQRYWGPPIPMIYCQSCADQKRSWFTTDEAKSLESGIMNHESRGKQNEKDHNSLFMIHDSSPMAGWYPVSEDQLPVFLPRIEDYRPGNDGVAPLAKHKEFYHVKCPHCGSQARRETDVSDTFLDSSWYFLRYPSVGAACVANENVDPSSVAREAVPSAKSPKASEAGQHFVRSSQRLPWDPAITKKWLPVHMYTGGAEHSVLHLMYSRFVTMFLKDLGLIDFEEPFTRFFAHGLVIKDGAKMSKSKGNVVNPDEYITAYGADPLRMYLMFMGPFDQGGDFRDSAMEGMSRWVGRVWRLSEDVMSRKPESSETVKNALQKLIKKVTDDIEKRRYNTAIASMMEFTNLVSDEGNAIAINDLKNLVLLLAPFAPYVTEELWFRCSMKSTSGIHDALSGASGQHFCREDSVHLQSWPAFDLSHIKEEHCVVVVQVNGKVRDTIPTTIAGAKKQSDMESLARNSENTKRHLDGKKIIKVIFIPGKLLNFVVA